MYQNRYCTGPIHLEDIVQRIYRSKEKYERKLSERPNNASRTFCLAISSVLTLYLTFFSIFQMETHKHEALYIRRWHT